MSPASPWQNPYVERLIGSVRRECLDHMIIVSDKHLRVTLHAYLQYYHRTRTHLGLDKDAPEHRPASPASGGTIVAVAEVGGLHHRYERRAAQAGSAHTGGHCDGISNRRPTIGQAIVRGSAARARYLL